MCLLNGGYRPTHRRGFSLVRLTLYHAVSFSFVRPDRPSTEIFGLLSTGDVTKSFTPAFGHILRPGAFIGEDRLKALVDGMSSIFVDEALAQFL
jgi:hypothetical protein